MEMKIKKKMIWLWVLLPIAFSVYLFWSSLYSQPVRVTKASLIKEGSGVFVSGVLVNQTDQTLPVLEIVVTFKDMNHKKVGQAETKIAQLGPGQKMPFKTETITAKDAEYFEVSFPGINNLSRY